MVKTRGFVVVVALVLAVVATGALFLYVRSVKTNAQTGGGSVQVVVSTKDVAAGTAFDSLSASQFQLRSVPRDTLVRDAVTSVDELRGRVAAQPIVAGSQISTAVFRNGTQVGGGVLGIPKGDVAVTVPLDASRVVSGVLGQGDHVVVYGTFDQDTTDKLPPTTVTLVPSVEVLKVLAPSTTGSTPTSNSSNTDTLVTLALAPADAAKVVFAQEQGSVWLALMAPRANGVPVPPVNERAVVTK